MSLDHTETNNPRAEFLPVHATEVQSVLLMETLIKRGYLNEALNEAVVTNPVESLHPTFDSSCVLRTLQGSFVSFYQLEKEFRDNLDTSKGRTTLKAACSLLRVDAYFIEKLIDLSFQSLHKVPGDIFLTPGYIENITVDIFAEIDSKHMGKLRIQDLAKELGLPADFLLSTLEGRDLPLGSSIRIQDDGYRAIVTPQYWTKLVADVTKLLLEKQEPVSVRDLCHENKWDYGWIKLITCDDTLGNFPGHFRGEIYEPNTYLEQHNSTLLHEYITSGYVTAATCKRMRVHLSQAKDLISSAHQDSVLLENMIIHPGIIPAPITAAVQETSEGNGWLDLHPLVHPDIAIHPRDTEKLLREHVFEGLEHDGCHDFLSVASEYALYVSHGMMFSISNSILPPLMNVFAKKAAKAVIADPPSTDVTSRGRSGSGELQSEVCMPIAELSRTLTEAYSDLKAWKEENMPWSDKAIDALSEYLCDQGDFRVLYERVVQTELRRLRSVKTAQVSISMENVQFVFEKPECFGAACYSIQLAFKFIQYAVKHETPSESIQKLQLEALQGPCADFCRRITEYTLLKNEIKTGLLSYGDDEDNRDSGTLPYFCSPADIARLHYPRLSLKCEPDDKGRARDSLAELREALPGSAGASLARMWILCEGDDLNSFIAHVDENCFTVTGLPFKKLDKKWEKQFLLDRRHNLLNKLSDATDPNQILELTIALLYQLLKSQYVSGDSLGTSILDLLCQERKISEDTVTDLKALATRVSDGSKIDQELVGRVKCTGLDAKTKKSIK